jgi:hypothetical protein
MTNSNLTALKAILDKCPDRELREESIRILQDFPDAYHVTDPIPRKEYADIARKRANLGGEQNPSGIEQQIRFMGQNEINFVLIHFFEMTNLRLTIVTDENIQRAVYVFLKRPRLETWQDHDLVWKLY